MWFGRDLTQRLRRFQAVLFAGWKELHSAEGTEQFVKDFEARSRSSEEASQWLNWPDLDVHLRDAARLGEPDGSLALLARRNLPLARWQQARVELGGKVLIFDRSVELFRLAASTLAGRCRAWFGWRMIPHTHRRDRAIPAEFADAAWRWTERICQAEVPDGVKEAQPEARQIVGAAAQQALRLLTAHFPELAGLQSLTATLQELAETGADITALKIRREPDKAALIYERDPFDHRGREAGEAIDIVIKIALALADHFREPLDDACIRRAPLVQLLGTGPWANRYLVLAALREAMSEAAPLTVARMQKGKAFRPVEDWKVLWKKFEKELGPVATKPAPRPSMAAFPVLGGAWTQDDFLASAAMGEDGAVAQSVLQAIVPSLELLSLQYSRGQLSEPVARPERRRGGGGGRPPSDEYLKMLGAVGEYFVFRQFEAIIPGFDWKNWKSRNREQFGGSEGDDTLGFDFEFYDSRGVLTVERVPRQYYLEVKSTASEAGRDTFEMSVPEWETAQRYTTTSAGWTALSTWWRVSLERHQLHGFSIFWSIPPPCMFKALSTTAAAICLSRSLLALRTKTDF